MLNPEYCAEEDFKRLNLQGLPVRWMEEDEGSDKDLFLLELIE